MKMPTYSAHAVKRRVLSKLPKAVHVANAIKDILLLAISNRLHAVKGEHVTKILPGDVLVSGTDLHDPLQHSIVVVARKLDTLSPRSGFMDLSPEDLRALSRGSALIFGLNQVQSSGVLRVGKEIVQVTYLNDHFRLELLDKRNRLVYGFVAVEGKVNVAKDDNLSSQLECLLELDS